MPTDDGATVRRATVVGAGPGGSAAALLLAAAGWEVTLLERVPEPAAVGAGLLLQPNGLAVLYGLGLEDALRAQAHEIRGGAIRSDRGRDLLRTRAPDFGAGLDHLLALRRSHLATVLTDAITASPRLTLRTGAEVVAATPDGVVTARTGDRDEPVAADLVVAADGVHSAVRASVGLGAAPAATGRTYLRAVVASETADGAADQQAEYWTPIGLFGCSPLGDGTTYFFADAAAPTVHAAIERRDLVALRAAWSDALARSAPFFDRLTGTDDLLVNSVQRVDVPTFVAGRVALLGDAAHAMAPNLGQGANSALVDAAVLVQELARTDDLAAALTAYDRRRRPAVRTVQRDSDRIARAAGLRNGIARRVRDMLLRCTPASATERRFRATQQEDPATLRRAVEGLVAGAG